MSETPHGDRPQGEPTEPTEPVTPPPPPPPGPTDPEPPATTPDPLPAEEPAAPPPPPGPDTPPPPPPPGSGDPQPYPPAGYAPSGYAAAPGGAPYGGPSGQAPLSPQDEKTWAMLSHVIGAVAMVVTSGVLGFVGSLVIYVLYKDRGPFVRAHAANSLNIQITTAIGVVISFVLMFVLIGFVTIFVVGIWAVVMHVIGAIKANNGEWWDPPLVPKFVR